MSPHFADLRCMDRPATRAFTLLEMLLTLAVLTAVAAVALPQLDVLLSGSRLERAADQMRIEMTRTRVDAMRQGKVLMMEVVPETGDFRVRAYNSLSDATETAEINPGSSALLTGADQAMAMPVQTDEIPVKEFTLPDNVTFGGVTVASTVRSMQVVQDAASDTAVMDEPIGDTASPILFYPDGTTSTAAIQLQNAIGEGKLVMIRGITGEVAIVSTAVTSEG
ncbi:prepilin-type N-terminal cleavage/methylation domain-containing protein [Crateriforma conspicua]|uniref:Prepilin-type N-terminal cleavage/methylation domain-containing protein n=2 Tax=Crateriforma TaxID=2714592 RepID=A0A5C6FRE7_9PLAN|nr:prepilin-type N-terminal cleavage/methylation domain-containing protein [Crateriforma conspicua]TWU65742.1 hypothetical protein V7x_12910 [Crateriforma conspicua]